MTNCDYWWFAGGVEWCDLMGSNCHCGGWETSCAMKQRRKKNNKPGHMALTMEPDELPRNSRHNHTPH